MIKIIKAGIQTSVQDLGRDGLRHLGICQSGALDTNALQQANILLGNPVDAAALEVTAGPVEIAIDSDCLVALSGADFNASIINGDTGSQTGHGIANGWRFALGPGERLVLRGNADGGRAYIAFSGGIRVDEQLDSSATDISAGFGGLAGRCLENGDTLSLGTAGEYAQRALRNSHPNSLDKGLIASTGSIGARQRQPGHAIRVIASSDLALLGDDAFERFIKTDWQVTPARNRMGARLHGITDSGASAQPNNPSLAGNISQTANSKTSHMYSHAVLPGTVQMPRNGKPIVLLADGQTTGGYPKIAHVIQADLWKLAQISPKTLFRFTPCSVDQAISALREEQQALFRLQQAVRKFDERG